MSVRLLTEQHLEFLCLTGGCTGSSESTRVKMPHCWKSHVTAHMIIELMLQVCDHDGGSALLVTERAMYYVLSLPLPVSEGEAY